MKILSVLASHDASVAYFVNGKLECFLKEERFSGIKKDGGITKCVAELIKKNYDIIEQYDFKEIINKYSLNDSIIALFFKNDKDLRVLSKITLKNNMVIKNQSFLNVDLKNDKNIKGSFLIG